MDGSRRLLALVLIIILHITFSNCIPHSVRSSFPRAINYYADHKYDYEDNFVVPPPRPPCLSSMDLGDPISDLVLKIIHEIQSHMKDGIPSMGIPPLDPLNISKYDFDVRESNFKAYGELRNVLVKNLSTFNVTNISTHLFQRSVNVSIEIPNLLITGTYTLKGKAFSFFPISGKGGFLLKPEDAKCTVFSQLGYKDEHFYLTSFDYKLSIGGLYAKFDGIYGGGLISDLLNTLLNKFGISLFNRLEPVVHEDIRKELEEDIDRILKDIKVSDVTGAFQMMATKSLC